MSRLYFPMKLRSFNVSSKMLVFYQSVVASVVTALCWGSSIRAIKTCMVTGKGYSAGLWPCSHNIIARVSNHHLETVQFIQFIWSEVQYNKSTILLFEQCVCMLSKVYTVSNLVSWSHLHTVRLLSEVLSCVFWFPAFSSSVRQSLASPDKHDADLTQFQ